MVSAAFMNMVIGAGKQYTTEYNDQRKKQLDLDAELIKAAQEAKDTKERIQTEYELRRQEMEAHDANTYELYWGKAQWKQQADAAKANAYSIPGMSTPPEGSPITTDPIYNRVQQSRKALQESPETSPQPRIEAAATLTQYAKAAEAERYGTLSVVHESLKVGGDSKALQNQYAKIINSWSAATQAEKDTALSAVTSTLSKVDMGNTESVLNARKSLFTTIGGLANEASAVGKEAKGALSFPLGREDVLPKPSADSTDPRKPIPNPIIPGTDNEVFAKPDVWNTLTPEQQKSLYDTVRSVDSTGHPDKTPEAVKLLRDYLVANEVPTLAGDKAKAESVKAQIDQTALNEKALEKLSLSKVMSRNHEGISEDTVLATPSYLLGSLASKATTGRLSPSTTNAMLNDAFSFYRTNPETKQALINATADPSAVKGSILDIVRNVNVLRYAEYKDESGFGEGTIVDDKTKKQAWDAIVAADANLDSVFNRKTKRIEALDAIRDDSLRTEVAGVLSPFKPTSPTNPTPTGDIKPVNLEGENAPASAYYLKDGKKVPVPQEALSVLLTNKDPNTGEYRTKARYSGELMEGITYEYK
jgi:hypothetical protein